MIFISIVFIRIVCYFVWVLRSNIKKYFGGISNSFVWLVKFLNEIQLKPQFICIQIQHLNSAVLSSLMSKIKMLSYRFIILPIGVVSKNFILDLIRDDSIFECKIVEDLIIIRIIKYSPRISKNPFKNSPIIIIF